MEPDTEPAPVAQADKDSSWGDGSQSVAARAWSLLGLTLWVALAISSIAGFLWMLALALGVM